MVDEHRFHAASKRNRVAVFPHLVWESVPCPERTHRHGLVRSLQLTSAYVKLAVGSFTSGSL